MFFLCLQILVLVLIFINYNIHKIKNLKKLKPLLIDHNVFKNICKNNTYYTEKKNSNLTTLHGH